jgi:hypothetical protein
VTHATPEVVQLDDLAEPRFSREAHQIRDMMAALAVDCPLRADALHAKAIADTGLDDFGPDDYRERLDVYLAALYDIDDMHAPGIVNFFGQLSQWLKNRLLLTDLLTRHPEIRDIELLPPIATRCRWPFRWSRCSSTQRACTGHRCRWRRSPPAGSADSN